MQLDWCARISTGVRLGGEANRGAIRSGLRIVAISAISGFLAPLVFVGVIVLRKVERRVHVHVRHWNKRLQHEIARWS